MRGRGLGTGERTRLGTGLRSRLGVGTRPWLETGVRTRFRTGARPRPFTATWVAKGVLLVTILAAASAYGCASAVGGGQGSEGREAMTGRPVVDRAAWLRGKGFQDREGWSSAALHLDRAGLANSHRFREVILTAPGIRIRPRPGNFGGVERVTGPTGAPCFVSVYLNGSRLLQPASQARVSLDAFIPVPSLDGLELHVGPSGPLGPDDGCGSLLLWALDRQEPTEKPFLGSVRGLVRSSMPDTAVAIRVRRANSGSPGAPSPGDTILHLDSDGAFALDGLLPGTYRLEILDPGGAAAQGRRLDPEERLNLERGMDPGGAAAPGSVLARQDLRVYAFRESVLQIDIVRRELPGGS